MKIWKCDRCGATDTPPEGQDYVEDWESVTISTAFHFDICKACAPALFKFFDSADKEQKVA